MSSPVPPFTVRTAPGEVDDVRVEAPRRRLQRSERQRLAQPVADLHDGVAHRRQLAMVGISREDIQGEVDAGRWLKLGKHTVVVLRQSWSRRAAWFHAMWESGSGAVLDGIAALQASGLDGFQYDVIDVAQPANNRRHRVKRVRAHYYKTMPPVVQGGVPRVRPDHASLHAAQWASTDRMAALILVLVVGQRIVRPEQLLATFRTLRRCTRRRIIAGVLQDICDGVRSLGELDFARLCRRHGLPPPSRQTLRVLPSGRAYLDVCWDDLDLIIEIDGGHHFEALSPMLDALRQNELVLTRGAVLRIPVLGLRLQEARFMDQVVRAHEAATQRAA